MPEPEGVVAGERRPPGADQLLADQGHQRPEDGRPQRLGRQLGDGAAPELLADHGGPFDDLALVLLQPVEPGGQERVDRRGHGHGRQVPCGPPGPVGLDQEALVDEHADHLLDEQGVALGRLRDPAPGLLG